MTNEVRLRALRHLAAAQAQLSRGQSDVWDDYDHESVTGHLQGALATLGFEALHAQENHLVASHRAYAALLEKED